MYKLCKTEQSAARQASLEEGLLCAMLTKSYEEISISSLCDELNIPRKAFYRYFDSKDGALHALIDHRLMAYELGTEPVKFIPRKGVLIDFAFYFSFWQTQKQLLDALARSGLSGILVQRAINYYQNIHYPEQAKRRQKPDDEYYAISFIVTGLMSMVIQWHHEGYQKSVGEMASIARRLMERPLADM